jgi:DNA-directed RNA polymerase specialized sigma24 family protein
VHPAHAELEHGNLDRHTGEALDALFATLDADERAEIEQAAWGHLPPGLIARGAGVMLSELRRGEVARRYPVCADA